MRERKNTEIIRILVWQWGQRGAGPRFAAEAAAALQDCGLDVTLSLSERAEAYGGLRTLCRTCLPFEGRAPGIPGWRVLLSLPMQLWRLHRMLRANPPTVALCAMVSYWDILFALMLRAMRVKVVTVVHEIEGHPGDNHAKLYPLLRLMVRLSGAIVTLSRHVTDQVSARWPSKNIVESFHPSFAFTDLNLPKPSVLPPRDGSLRLLITGRLWAYKGITLALSAMDRLPAGMATLRIVGSGDAPLPSAAGPQSGVTLERRWLSERDLIEEIDASHVVLFPYVEASQSGIVPLCLSRGRPVIVTDIGGLPEQVRDGKDGLIVDPSGAGIAVAIADLVRDPDVLSEFSASALRSSDPAKGWQAFARRLVPILHTK